MAQSLVKLTLESNQYERGLKNAQKQLNDFTRAIGVNMKSLSGMALAAGAVTTAMKVAKDAFFKNEQQLDEWGRTVEASKSLYSGFLNALNNGDISGFLNNINNITDAARAAYNALDELSTFNAFNQIQTQKARTGFTEAMAGYRLGEGSKEDVQKAAKAYQEELRTRMQKEQEAYSQAVRKIAAERGVSWGGLEQALTGKYGDYETLKNTMPTGKKTKFTPGGMFGGSTAVEVPVAVTVQEKMGEALRQLNDTELKELQALGAQAQRTAEEIAQIDKQMARVLNGRQPGTGSSSGSGGSKGSNSSEPTYAADSIAAQQKLVSELTRQWTEAGASVRNDYIQPLIEAETKLKEMKDEQALLKEQAQGKLKGGEVETPAVADVSSSIYTSIDEIRNELAENPIVIPIESTEKDVKAIAKAASITADVVGSIGDAFNAIEDPAGKVMGTVMQSIASVALGYANATVQASEMGPWAWVAFAVSGLATMMSMIQGIHSATGYAQGGIVEGNSYSGDNMMFGGDGLYGLNAGEVVLTKAQQNNLAQTLEGNGLGNINVTGRLNGTDILLSADRAAQASGRGQLVTWK